MTGLSKLWLETCETCLTVWTLALLLITFLVYHWWKRPHASFPPGPRGVPLFGVLPFLGPQPQKTLRKYALHHGPVMSVRMGNKDFVFLNTFDAIYEALVKQSEIFSDRPAIELYDQVLCRFGITFTGYSERQRVSKQLALKCLKRLGLGTKKMEEVINEEAQMFLKLLESKQNQPLTLNEVLPGFLCNVMATLVVGKRFDYDDATVKIILRDGIAKPHDSKLKLPLMYFYKYLRHIPPFKGVNQRFVKAESRAADIYKNFVNEHLQKFSGDSSKDFVDIYLSEREKKQKLDPLLTDRQLEGCVRDFIAAGSGDLRILLNWDFLCLLSYPKYYEEIMREINSVIGPEEAPSMAHLKQMPVTYAFLQEVWRFSSLVPNGVVHSTTRDTELFGFHIPKNTRILPNIYAAHYDPKVWKDPESFNPHRHIDEDGNFVRSHKIIPCSIGPRFCLGRDIAHVIEFIVFVNILLKFRLSPATHPLPSIFTGNTTLVYTPHKYQVILTPMNK